MRPKIVRTQNATFIDLRPVEPSVDGLLAALRAVATVTGACEGEQYYAAEPAQLACFADDVPALGELSRALYAVSRASRSRVLSCDGLSPAHVFLFRSCGFEVYPRTGFALSFADGSTRDPFASR